MCDANMCIVVLQWNVLDTVLATVMLQSPAFIIFADLGNVSIDGGVEIF